MEQALARYHRLLEISLTLNYEIDGMVVKYFMQLNHIGVNIANVAEVQHFYQHILKFLVERRFFVPRNISQMFFGIDAETEVFIVNKETLRLELFVYNEPLKSGYAHLCVEVDDREKTASKCAEQGYPVIRMKRDQGDLLFIKDKAGNVFELKNKPHENLS